MNRREFGASILAVSSVALGAAPAAVPASSQPLRVNSERLLEHLRRLGEFGKNPQGGVSRVAYSEADLAGRDYVMELMDDVALAPTIDAAGNIIGRRAGDDPSLTPLMFGSHIDSVPEGGNYDGPLGSLAAVEVVQTVLEHDVVTRHPLEVAIFQNEEGGKTGSRAMIGEVQPRELDLVTNSGFTIGDGITRIGGDPAKLEAVAREPGSVAAYLELHIEQGGTLEQRGIDIGVVQGIVGIRRWYVTVEGIANHAGTTPMNSRHDALLAAARLIDAVNSVVRSESGSQVGTVGWIEASPGAPNVIPGRARLSLELRDLHMEKIERLFQEIRQRALTIGEETGTAFSFDEFYLSAAALADRRIQQLVAEAADQLGLTNVAMPSGAGHDAQSIAKLAPMGMIFVPSVGGISHSPNEFTRPEDVGNGADVLLHSLLKADRVL
jgi:N-carbamoyl-L-amino-acid hydrolase